MLSKDDELIYYGRHSVSLYPVTGVFHKYSSARIRQDPITEQSAKEALRLLEDLSCISKDYADHYLPCVPETFVRLEPSGEEPVEVDEFVSSPLIKLPFGPEDSKATVYSGIASGHRSAIIKGKSGEFYRLKGCGNDLEGFTIKKCDGFFLEYGIRGAQYECTAARELYYSDRVQSALKPHNISVSPCSSSRSPTFPSDSGSTPKNSK